MMKHEVPEQWQLKLEQLLEKFGTPDMKLDYPNMTLKERRGLYYLLLKREE